MALENFPLRLCAFARDLLPSTEIAYLISPLNFMHDFRAERVRALDGLRGVAILLVVAHHQLIPFPLTGGFLGVDIFFVLSGFLITTLLLREFDATQTVSLKNFYVRRALRLGPALVVYLVAALVVTYFLQPQELTRQFRLVVLALVYLTNWRLALDWDSSPDPTAIVWSLSIEEQFYLAWPLLLVVGLTIGAKKRHLAMVLVLLISMIMFHRLQLWSSGTELHRMYYGSDTRADAPLMGCLLALLPLSTLQGAALRVLKMASAAAIALLLYLIVTTTFTDVFLYQWGYTAIAALAALVVWRAVTQTSFSVRVLEFGLLRWLGKISYALYLWHWLLLKSTSFYFVAGEKWDPWIRFAVAILVSAASFYLIELPFNRLKARFVVDSASQLPVTQTEPRRQTRKLQTEQALSG